MARGKEPGSETVEVTNGFWSCRDISDIVPLYTPISLYLKPTAKVNVSVSLPQLKTPGKTISTWDVMEKIRYLIRPDEFGSLKVTKSTLEFIRLEGDVRDRSRLSQVLARLDSQCLKLEGFTSTLKVRAVETKDDFPTRHSWDSYFRDAKHMNELKAGERPDTIHITGLPVKWFSEGDSKVPSEALIKKVFSKWGTLRRIDVPVADPFRSRMRLGQNIQKFNFEDGLFFDAYVQYVEYMDFVLAMDALRGMKLLKKEDKNYLIAAIKVDFDKTKHMSDNSVSQRAFERKRLITQDSIAAEKLRKQEELRNKKREELKKKEEVETVEKDTRRRQREEKRKRNALTIFRKQEEDKVSMKIAREERKLIKAQRQLESIRLLDALFDRIKIKVEKKEIDIDTIKDSQKKADKDGNKSDDEKNDDKKKSKKKKIKKKKKKSKKGSSSSSLSDSDEETNKKKLKSVSLKALPASDTGLPYPAVYPRFGPQPWYYETPLSVIYPPTGRGFPRERRGRGSRGRNRGYWRNDGSRSSNSMTSNFYYNKQYYKYFASLTGQDFDALEEYDRNSRSRSRRLSKSRSRSRSPSRKNKRRRSSTRSRSRNRSRSRSRRRRSSSRRSRSRTRNKGKSRSRSTSSRSKHKSKRSRTRSRSRQRSRQRSKSKVKSTKSKSPTKRNSRSSSWSLPKTPEKQRSCSWSKLADEKR